MARGWCNKHYKRWRNNGDPLRTAQYSFPENLLRRLKFIPPGPLSTGCIEFTGALTRKGYGMIAVSGKKKPVHRAAFELLRGHVPDDLVIDHLCRNRACVNPAHLEAVTSAENSRRGDTGQHLAVKTHCPAGHPYDEANTYVAPAGDRRCRTCRREIQRRHRRERREAVARG